MVSGSRRWSNQSPTGMQNQWLFVCHVTKWCKTIWQTRNTIYILHQDRLWDPELHIGRLSVRIFWFMVRKYISHIYIYIYYIAYVLWTLMKNPRLFQFWAYSPLPTSLPRRFPRPPWSASQGVAAASARCILRGPSVFGHKKPAAERELTSRVWGVGQCWSHRKWEDAIIVIITISIIMYIFNNYIHIIHMYVCWWGGRWRWLWWDDKLQTVQENVHVDDIP